MRVEIRSASPGETLALGIRIGGALPAGAIVGLDGPLAAGKTWLAKGIVQGLGPYDATLVKSPAYNLIHEYELEQLACSVYHMDFYRLDRLSEHDALLFGEILDQPDAVCLVEWAGRFLADLVPGYLSIVLSKPGMPAVRDISIEGVGDSAAYAGLLNELMSDADADT